MSQPELSAKIKEYLWGRFKTYVDESSEVGNGAIIHLFCNIYNNTVLGDNCKIGSYVEISGAKLGNRVSVGAYSFIPAGVTIEDNAVIGPGVHFTHEFPPKPKNEWAPILVKRGAMIGSKSVIMPGVTINEGAIVGAGSVVTKDIPAGETWAGVPARKLK